MTLTKHQLDALLVLRARLDVRHPGYAGSDEITAARGDDAGSYIDTWVLPLLDIIEGQGDQCDLDDVERDANQVRDDISVAARHSDERHCDRPHVSTTDGD